MPADPLLVKAFREGEVRVMCRGGLSIGVGDRF